MGEDKAKKTRSQPLVKGGFGHWARPAVLGLLVFFAASFAAAALFSDPTPIGRASQPIAFNHQRHVDDLGLECEGCHQYYKKETFSGLPEAEVCEFCHAEAQGESAAEAQLVQLLGEGKPLEWQSLFQQPSHVFFTHRRHVVVAQMECSVCHGEIASSERPPDWVKLLTMDDCVDCHQREDAATRCTACHR